MADQEQVALLKQGAEVWNRWRKENSDTGIDLRDANLSGAKVGIANLSGANLSGANLSGAHLNGAYLSSADLRGANLGDANFSGTNLNNAKLRAAKLRDANLRAAHLRGADLGDADLRAADLSRADLNCAYLSDANLRAANLSGANLIGAYLSRANFSVADLSRADLSRADLSRANLNNANFSVADLSRADLSRADLSRANFSAASFSVANLSDANLSGANFSAADLSDALLYETIFADVDLSQVKGLAKCAHRGPSIIDHRTLSRSGQLPTSFLRGIGLPDTFIDYIPSLFNQPIQFYSCFISYSHKDEEFAKRLHADLQDKGVRCWYAPEDLPIGEKIRVGIDQAIRRYDKLLLILSEHSVDSQWVESEVESALEKERENNKLVLFPVRIDDTVMQSRDGWPRMIRNTRNIGNFCNWKDYDAYQKVLERLVRDLKESLERRG